MSLGLQSRCVGEVMVVTCSGRLVAGEETAAFQAHVDALLPMNPRLVLDVANVEFIDSGGVGLLVRYFTRARNAHGALSICALSPKIAEVLKITRLDAVFQPYDTAADAIADAHGPARRLDPSFVNPSILCVDRSPDVLAYLRELLKEAGYGVLTAGNLPDALILLIATRPTVVVMGRELQAAAATGTAGEFHRLANARAVVELPSDFAAMDAGESAAHVLEAVRAHLPPGTTAPVQAPNARTV
jgi:anti-sigma B factor antagonist